MRVDRVQLGANQERVPRPSVVDRLDAQRVSREWEDALRTIPQRDGEHAVEFSECLFESPLFGSGENHLRVGAASETVATSAKVMLEVRKIVDLAIERDDISAAFGHHGLVPHRG